MINCIVVCKKFNFPYFDQHEWDVFRFWALSLEATLVLMVL